MEVRRLGLVPYPEAWELQKRLVLERAEGRIPDTLLLLQHPAVVTYGASALPPGPLPIPVFQVERGGDATYHGPGQIVGYPILKLSDHGLGVRDFLRFLEGVLIEAVRETGVPAERLPAFTGVWSGGKKIASIGVAVKRGVSYHGFALNVDCDLAGFRAIHPCKLEPEQIATVASLARGPVSLAALEGRIAELFSRALQEKAVSA